MQKRILRLPKVIDRVGYSRSWIYKAISDGVFPPPYRLGNRAIGWLESDIDKWIESRVQKVGGV
jgi:prophage regulatory protein